MDKHDFPELAGVWCEVARTRDVGDGEIVSAPFIRALTASKKQLRPAFVTRGPEILVWRGSDGIAQVSESRCAHQFVHLASEGFVDDCELVCSAHFWRFARDGFGTRRDSAGNRETVTGITAFPTKEINTLIWANLPSGWFEPSAP
jgi:nitrite reductase/ring-hydroxylating ferredoxin subunit